MKQLLVLAALLWLASLPALVVNHVPPLGYESGRQQELRLEVLQGWSELAEGTLYYREQGGSWYQQSKLSRESPDGPWLTGVLPAAAPGRGYEYYFQFALANGDVATLPVAEAASRPFRLDPRSGLGEEEAAFVLLSDEPAIPASGGYVLAVSWYALEDELDLATLQVFVNGKNVNGRAVIGDNALVYRDAHPRPGQTTAYLTARTKGGRSLYSATWVTQIKASGRGSELPLNLRGAVNAGANVYVSAKDPGAVVWGSDKDDAWASLELNSEYKKLAVSAYSYLSTLDKDQPQSVNRYRLGLALPGWESYLGDYAPDLSKLTMSNKNLRGIYSSLATRGFGLTLALGEMLRAVEGDAYEEAGAQKYGAGTFKQEALALRMRVGSEQGFSLAFSGTRNRDIISSLDTMYVQDGGAQIAFPRDNLVLGSEARLNLPAQNTVLGLEGAFSLYNKNTLTGALSQSELGSYLGEDADIDPQQFEDIFIINTHVQPLPISGTIKHPFPFSAWTAYARSLWFNNLMNLSYSRVGPYYRALSAGYLHNDAATLSFTDQFNYKQYLFLTAGLTNIRDNLAKHQLETNHYTSYFGQLLLSLPGYPHFSLAYSGNLGSNEPNARIDSLGVDLYNPYRKSSHQLALGIGYAFQRLPVAPSIVELGWRLEHYGEERQEALARNWTETYDNTNTNVSLSLSSKFDALPLKTQISFAYNQQELVVEEQKKSNLSLMLRGEYRLYRELLQPWVEFRSSWLGGDQDSQNYNYFTLGLLATPWPDTNVSASLGARIYSNADQEDVDYLSTTLRLALSQRF